ncbi:MAG TPA: delta-60 repeat domain-containing protein, partial [Rhodanobacteraceae bacterium]|nr:delta-60 repeat domain-containing protein [Rhodanobacteraceae bacterium]
MLTMKRHPRTRATSRVQPRQRSEPIGIAGRVSATLAASLLAMLPVRHAIAHAGDLDPSFGNGGLVIVPNLRADAPFDEATAVAIQPDGKIVVAGRWGGTGPGPTFAIVRFNADGSLDGTFGVDGIVTLSSGFAGGDEAHGVAIAGDGKITVGGYFGSLGGVYRLESDGSLDGGFGSAGSVVVAANGDSGHRTTINSLVLDGSGGTLVAGDYFGSGHGEYMLGWLAADGTILSAVPVSLVVPDRDQIATA